MADTTAWMPLYPANFLCDTLSLTAAQTGNYATLMAYAWRSGGVPNDYEACRRIAREMTPEDWQVIRTFFVVADPRTSEERLVLEWQEAERSKAITKYNDKVASIEKARKAKAERLRSDANADVSHDVSVDANPDANADISPQLQLQTQLQTQIQIQEQDNTTEATKVASDSDKAKPRRKRSRSKSKLVTWSLEEGFQGITDVYLEAWKDLYPHVDIAAVIKEAHVELLGNPGKRHRKNYFTWLGHWFKNRNRPAVPALAKRENCL